MRKTKIYLKKNTQMTLTNYIQISQGKGKKKDLLGMWVRIIPILKITFHLKMRVFLKYMIISKLRKCQL